MIIDPKSGIRSILYPFFSDSSIPLEFKEDPKFVIVEEDSLSNEASEFEEQSLDFLFFNRPKTYTKSMSTLNIWYSKVKEGGYIAGNNNYINEIKHFLDDLITYNSFNIIFYEDYFKFIKNKKFLFISKKYFAPPVQIIHNKETFANVEVATLTINSERSILDNNNPTNVDHHLPVVLDKQYPSEELILPEKFMNTLPANGMVKRKSGIAETQEFFKKILELNY